MSRKNSSGFGWMSDSEFDTYSAIQASKGVYVMPLLNPITFVFFVFACIIVYDTYFNK